MKRILLLLLVGCVAMGMASVASAGKLNDRAGIAMHIAPFTGNCPPPVGLTPADILTSAPCGDTLQANHFGVYILICNGSDSLGLAGMEFGIQYGPYSYVAGWQNCATLDFQQNGWPGTGSGNLVTWNRTTMCQRTNAYPLVPGTVVAIGGVLDVYSYGPDLMQITPNPVSNRAKVADCRAKEWDLTNYIPSHLGSVGFCEQGYNPCDAPTATLKSTWGRIKTKF